MTRQQAERIIPENTLIDMKQWVLEGICYNEFLIPFIQNDLKNACNEADEGNKRAIWEVHFWFYNYAPGDCRGSFEKYEAWVRRHQEMDKLELHDWRKAVKNHYKY